ncbi:hypothetical protein [Sutterella sp.]|uniref:hypothetical protein n=1 Tax=Sutterella sp. TaxID=1981025 RepID=UPI0026DFE175|nr:hypothetical protein [Sutterella sp.]MDO5532833.1 hypothetical protein [Sutterella sp.]
MNQIIAWAQTPLGLLIIAAVGFIVVCFVITWIIFAVAGLFRGRPRAEEPAREEPGSVNEADEPPAPEASSDPLESFDRRALKAPIALARLRARGPDVTRPAEPVLARPAPVEPAVAVTPEPEIRTLTDAVPESVMQAVEPEPAPAPAPAVQPQAVPSRQLQEAPFTTPVVLPHAPDPFANAEFLLTLPFERRTGLTMAHADLCGAGVEAVFFAPETVSRWESDELRLVPFLPQQGAKLLATETDRETFHAGDLFAQPDAVIELSTGLIALEYKSRGGRLEDPLRWAESMRPKDILQTVLAALALSAESGRPVAPVLRTTNAVFFLRPTRELRTLLVTRLPSAAAFLAESLPHERRPGISAADYAELLIPVVSRIFPRAESAGSAAGKEAHLDMLTRRS